MKYEPGHSGNPSGRPRGARNKDKASLQSKIDEYLERNFKTVFSRLDTPEGLEKARLYCKLLKYASKNQQAEKN